MRRMYLEDQQEVRYGRGPPPPSVPRYQGGATGTAHNGYTGDDEMGYTGRRDRGGGGGSKKNRDYFYHRLRYPAKGHSASPPVQGVAARRDYDYYPQSSDVRHTKSAKWMRSGSARDGSRDVSEFYSRSGPSLSHERQSPLSPSRNGGGAGGARDLARQAQFQRKARAQSVKLNRGGKRKEMNLDLVTTDL